MLNVDDTIKTNSVECGFDLAGTHGEPTRLVNSLVLLTIFEVELLLVVLTLTSASIHVVIVLVLFVFTILEMNLVGK